MPQEERYGNRSLTYSAWHRTKSIRRYIDLENAYLLAQIDLDHTLWIEYEEKTKEPLALVEEAQDVGQGYKCATVTSNLARKANIPALLVLWTPSDRPNPADTDWPDIVSFRIKRLWPNPEAHWRTLTPKEYAQTLLKMRDWQVSNH